MRTVFTASKLNPIAFLGRGRSTWDRFGLEQDEIVDYFQELLQLIHRGGYPLVESNTATMCQFWVSKRRSDRCLRSHCGAGESFQAVSAAGDIYPCGRATQSPGLVLGNVDDDWDSLSAPATKNRFVQEIAERSPRDFDDCRHCHYQQLCQAGCSAQAYERYGTVRHKTPECTFFKTMYPWLAEWLVHDESALRHFSSLNYFGAPAQVEAISLLEGEVH